MKKPNLILMVFVLMNFILGMLMLVFTGILDSVAVSLHISVAKAGLLNTMYAYGAAFGVPVTLIVFKKIERIRMIKIMLFLTIVVTLAMVFANSFTALLVLRLLMGISANSFAVLALAVAIALSPKERTGRSVSLLLMGAAMAQVLGVPLTRAFSSVLDWHGIFWILNAIMAICLLCLLKFLPGGDHESTKMHFGNELKYLRNGKILLIIAFSILMFVGFSAFYTYITPYLLQLVPSLEASISLILILFGLASVVGNWLGGQLSDRIGYANSMLFGAIVQTGMVVLILLAHPSAWLSVAMMTLWLISVWFTGLQLNTGVAYETQNQSSFMLSMNSSGLQLGGAIGSSISAVVIPLYGVQSVAWITLTACLGITLIQWISVRRFGKAGAGQPERAEKPLVPAKFPDPAGSDDGSASL